MLALRVVTISIFSASLALGSPQCRCFPGDECWPSPASWADLNGSVNGRLVATVPLASICHDPNYDATLCNSIQGNWSQPALHYDSTSSSILAPFFDGNSCGPFTPESMPCTLSNYPSYAINVTNPVDISKGVAFATKHNIRLVIRNTGHDYFGKSTGAGALEIWTHYLKTISFSDYNSSYYTGKAIKVGSGVQGFEVSEAAHSAGLAVVCGTCPTVGFAGGYTQGGGHSELASKYGMAADQTLEWEVITGAGDFVTANPTQNADLYWALSGGGGGTYGIVYSLTSKAHKDTPVSGASLSFYREGLSTNTYYAGLTAWHKNLPNVVDAGIATDYTISKDYFGVALFTGPGISTSQSAQLLQPVLDNLKGLGINYNLTGPIGFPSYLDQFNAFEFPNVNAPPPSQFGGRLIPRSIVENNVDALTAAIRNITLNEAAPALSGVCLNVAKSEARGTANVDNAVLPAWRDALIHLQVVTNWNYSAPLSDMVALQKVMTDELLPQLESITPGSGCYLNEGDPFQPNFQETFYGANYPRLRAIKAKYDPCSIFYGKTAVGSDEWEADVGGRLCRV